jgi:glucose/mannose-6-phosphate isomerase
MKKLIEDFSKHLTEALEIGANSNLSPNDKSFDNVLICGLGGSGIGGSIVAQLVGQQAELPIVVNKDYHNPGFVNQRTLVVLCSYSGNTEETIIMLEGLEGSGAEIACITSGGKLVELAETKGYNCIKIPGGMPPRAAFGYSFPQLFIMLNHYGIVDKAYESAIKQAVQLLNQEEEAILSAAKTLAENLHNKLPILYSDAWYEGVTIRFRQQINENAKMLCWHHCIPEMNHNELVGWKQKNDQLAVVLLRNKDDFYRTQKRMEINKGIFAQYTPHIYEVHSKGESAIEQSLYLIHFGDWVSYFLAEIQQIDAVEVDVITHLKGELSKI